MMDLLLVYVIYAVLGVTTIVLTWVKAFVDDEDTVNMLSFIILILTTIEIIISLWLLLKIITTLQTCYTMRLR